jgi:hypothetical protein
MKWIARERELLQTGILIKFASERKADNLEFSVIIAFRFTVSRILGVRRGRNADGVGGRSH